jgi:hypothetical protein
MMVRRSTSEEGASDLKRIASFPDVIMRADYPAIISHWSQFVAQERILILYMDDIVATPLKLMADVCEFLSIDFKEGLFKRLEKPTHVGDKIDMPPEIYELLKEQLRPIYIEMAKLFPEIASRWIQRHY